VDSLQKLLDSALKFLSYRPRSKKEVESFLRKKTSDATLINQTIEKLEKLKLIDDAEFAKWLVESRSRSRPRGLRLLKQELKSKGVTMNADSMTTYDETTLATKALEKKQNTWSKLSANDYRLKATRYLQYRGFSWDTIAKVVKKRYN